MGAPRRREPRHFEYLDSHFNRRNQYSFFWRARLRSAPRAHGHHRFSAL
jgi:hypothetical protein